MVTFTGCDCQACAKRTLERAPRLPYLEKLGVYWYSEVGAVLFLFAVKFNLPPDRLLPVYVLCPAVTLMVRSTMLIVPSSGLKASLFSLAVGLQKTRRLPA